MPKRIRRADDIPVVLQFDDVILVPQKSNVIPAKADTTTHLGSIPLYIPILSAAMDTVTDSRLAGALASEGGVGVVHRNITIEQQVEEVKKVKRLQAGMVMDPLTVRPDDTIEHAQELRKRYGISGLLVTTKDNVLVGILSNRDFPLHPGNKEKVRDFMTKDVITAEPGISLEEAEKILRKRGVEKLPLVDKKTGKLKGLMTRKDIVYRIRHPHACRDGKGRLVVGAAVGVSDAYVRAKALVTAEVDILVVDSAHGHSDEVLHVIRKLKTAFPMTLLTGGNVSTAEGARAVILAGADVVKAGQAVGSICTTGVITGSGMTQFEAIRNCSRVCRRYGRGLIADGAIRYSGDIAKALAAGADAVMIGSLFAGTKESPGEIILFEGRQCKLYVGMGSVSKMPSGSADRYSQDSATEPSKLVSEGIQSRVPYRGELSHIVFQLVGGLKAGMGMVGARTIRELQKKAKFVRLTEAGKREIRPHDVEMVGDEPNYSK